MLQFSYICGLIETFFAYLFFAEILLLGVSCDCSGVINLGVVEAVPLNKVKLSTVNTLTGFQYL
jgi:hypothetical protein